jgi:hypothetical protein
MVKEDASCNSVKSMNDVTSNSTARRSYYERFMERTKKQCNIAEGRSSGTVCSRKISFPIEIPKTLNADLYGRLYGENFCLVFLIILPKIIART